MQRFFCQLFAAALIATPFAFVSQSVEAKTPTQIKHERKAAHAKAVSKAKSDARKKR